VKRTPLSHLLAALVAGVLVVATGCPKKDEAGKDGTSASSSTGPVAKINGEEISRSDFDKQMERTRSRFQRAGRQIAPALETRLKENLIRKLVEERLLEQKAKQEGVAVEAAELDAKFTEHKSHFGSDKAFAAFLERNNQSETEVKQDLEKTLLREKLFAKLLGQTEPTEDDAKKYYEENKDKYKQKEQIRASHVLLKVEKTTPDAEKKKKLETAKKVLAEAKKKDANFEEIAKKYSEGPTAQRGGELGTFSRGRMVKAFEDAAFAAKPGEVIGPVETQFGYHVIKVYEKTPEMQRPYEDVKDSILTSIKARQKSKATRELLDSMRKDAKIEILEPGVSLEPKRAAIAPIGPDGKPLPEAAGGAPVEGGALTELPKPGEAGAVPAPAAPAPAVTPPNSTDPAPAEGAKAP
jgi:peptidyl-prolyl cis-trans isomerase C